MSGMTGKDMFEFGGELYEDDEGDGDEEWDISRLLARYVGHSPLDSSSRDLYSSGRRKMSRTRTAGRVKVLETRRTMMMKMNRQMRRMATGSMGSRILSRRCRWRQAEAGPTKTVLDPRRRTVRSASSLYTMHTALVHIYLKLVGVMVITRLRATNEIHNGPGPATG